MAHIYVSKLNIIDSDNGLSPVRPQAIIWTNVVILLIWPLGTKFSEMLIKILTVSFTKRYFKMSAVKWWPFYFVFDVKKWLRGTKAHSRVFRAAIVTGRGPRWTSGWSVAFSVAAACMMTSSNGNIFRVTGHLCGEFTGLRWIPRTKASDAEFDVFFDIRRIKRLSKHPWGWWFETQSWSLKRHCNVGRRGTRVTIVCE